MNEQGYVKRESGWVLLIVERREGRKGKKLKIKIKIKSGNEGCETEQRSNQR